MITELFSAKRVQSFKAVRFEEVKLLLHSVDASSGPVNLSELILSLSNNVVCRIALGKRYGDKGNESTNGRSLDPCIIFPREAEHII
ncbi:hypothetical protein RJT34_14176 [Clitoria ternatea]|uniref:Uncharacterized protein n=1 Tax=Clitoria ternatea TaxID=43366 RepID=A0AAN9PMI2_CLITE